MNRPIVTAGEIQVMAAVAAAVLQDPDYLEVLDALEPDLLEQWGPQHDAPLTAWLAFYDALV